MKRLLAYLLTSVACFAGDMIRTAESDFKKPAQWYADNIETVRMNLGLSKEEDSKALDHFEQEMYMDAMMEVSGPFFRGTKLRKGDDWKKLWADRQKAALDEVAGDKAARDSLAKALLKLRDYEDERDATILERVVKAKFGGEDVWILLVHWERADTVAEELNAGKEAILGHFLVIAVRASDQKIVSRAMCG